jgi:hypothetical protein
MHLLPHGFQSLLQPPEVCHTLFKEPDALEPAF